VWPTKRGLGKTSPERQRWHEEQPHLGCFDSRLLGHQPNQQHSLTRTTTERRSQHQEKAGDKPSAAASAGLFPERDLASDLLGPGASDESAWWRRERKMRGVFRPRWRWRSPPELAGEARRRQRRSSVASELEGRERSARGLGWVG
jgi:hypothetical protein